MLRAKQTAEILKEYINYDIEIIEESSFSEQSYGEFR
jgi:broad specificity phosphatase PhoE